MIIEMILFVGGVLLIHYGITQRRKSMIEFENAYNRIKKIEETLKG